MLASACHCHSCQKLSGSAFSLTMTLPSEGFAVTEGEPVVAGLLPQVRHHYCARCHDWLFTRAAGMEFLVNLRPSVLDDHGWFAPFIEVRRAKGLPWASTGAVRSYEEEPAMDAYQDLVAAYAASLASRA